MSRYLRVIVTPRCSLACSYCHLEGDPATARRLDTTDLVEVVSLAIRRGVRKIKYLGGEPLLRTDLPEIVARVAAAAPGLVAASGYTAPVDQSIITSGAARPERLEACLSAGLDRANMSVHGWGLDAFAKRGGDARLHGWRQANLGLLLAHGRPLKLNYVWGGPEDDGDLGELLAWAAGRRLVVNVLDDLSKPIGPADLEAALLRLRGSWASRRIEPDPYSLPTTRLLWADGLEVEIKDQRLGEVAPWRACATCPARARCREGIHAIRLSHDGLLRTCMDRPDLSADLLAARREGRMEQAWSNFLENA